MKKMFLFIKNMFIKQEEVKNLAESKIIVNEDKKESFIESLKIKSTEKSTNKKVETLTCNGDGLGIQQKILF